MGMDRTGACYVLRDVSSLPASAQFTSSAIGRMALGTECYCNGVEALSRIRAGVIGVTSSADDSSKSGASPAAHTDHCSALTIDGVPPFILTSLSGTVYASLPLTKRECSALSELQTALYQHPLTRSTLALLGHDPSDESASDRVPATAGTFSYAVVCLTRRVAHRIMLWSTVTRSVCSAYCQRESRPN
jgi:hypothetical protein